MTRRTASNTAKTKEEEAPAQGRAKQKEIKQKETKPKETKPKETKQRGASEKGSRQKEGGPEEGNPEHINAAEIKALFEQFGRDPKFKPLRGSAPETRAKGVAPKDVNPELIRNWLHFATLEGRFELINAHLLALKEIPNDVRLELDIASKLIKERRHAEASRALKDLAHWHDAELRRIELGDRTKGRIDRVIRQQVLDWASGLADKTAKNLTEVRKIAGFQESWIDQYDPAIVRGWLREAGFVLQRGAPKGGTQKRIIR